MAEFMRPGLAEYRLTVAQASWLGAGCIAATLVLGFGVAGWVTGGTAKKQADEAAFTARTELGVALCVEEFMEGRDATKRLSSLKEASWHQRDKLVSDAGFATLPGAKVADTAVAAQCAAKLSEQDLKKTGP